MKFKLQLIIDDEKEPSRVEDIITIDNTNSPGYCVGLSLQASQQLLKCLQQKMVLYETKAYCHAHRICPDCYRQRKIKGYHTIQFATLFGTVVIPSPRLYYCPCQGQTKTKTFSLLQAWLPDHTSPEFKYIETKWAAYMAFNKVSALLSDVLPIGATHNKETVRNHLYKVAKRQESELAEKPMYVSGCANDWAKLPKPGKPLTVGIDGGYVRSCVDKQTNFEVIVGKSFSKTQATQRFGFVQSMDDRPQRRLLALLRQQGMQENQQITFLSDGAENVRDLQYIMHPESEHVLDWFHLTMRFTVLNQLAKGLIKTNTKAGEEVKKNLESAKWYLWHGNVDKSLEGLDTCYCLSESDEVCYTNQKKLLKYLEELMTYIENNRELIPNYGEKWRYGETITTSFVESTVNEVVTKRMVKKQQMQWSAKGAHYLLQARTAVLNGELSEHFERWYPGLVIQHSTDSQLMDNKMAA